MDLFWKGTQLYVGAEERRTFCLEHIRRSIGKARDIAAVDGLMIQCLPEAELEETLVGTSRDCGLSTYLWFPVLADSPGAPARRQDRVLNLDGSRGNGRIGRWEALGGDESFDFQCPNNAPALERVLASYRSRLDRLEVDGVMLDKIRFPSPVNGFETLLGCYCDFCRRRFEARYGYPLEALRERACRFLNELAEAGCGRLQGRWNGSDALLSAAGLQDLSDFRSDSILQAVRRFSDEARSRSLKVGLDLYSPSLSGLVAQRYGPLGELADWVKPMIYCRAVGPAGLPLELVCLRRALGQLCGGLRAGELSELLRAAFGWRIPESDERLLGEGLPESTLAAELALIRKAGLNEKTRVLAGVEAVSNPRFGIHITREILGRYLGLLGEPARGLIASWNLLYIPEENLRLIGEA